MAKGNCQFKGTGGQYFSTFLVHLILLNLLTFGIYGAWGWVRIFKLKASHTKIDGQQVTFTGSGGDFFVLMLVQGLLTALTFGIYMPWAFCSFYKWKAQNTVVGDKRCEFTGTGGEIFFFFLVHMMILPMVTLGIYFFYGVYRLSAWEEEHTKYGGERTSFGAGFGGFLKVTLLTTILGSIPIVNIFSAPWTLVMWFKWHVSGLAVGDKPEVEHFPPVKTNLAAVAACLVIGLIPTVTFGFYLNNKYNDLKRMTQMAVLQMNSTPGKKGVTFVNTRPTRSFRETRKRLGGQPRGRQPGKLGQKRKAKAQPLSASALPKSSRAVKTNSRKEWLMFQKEMKRVNEEINQNNRNPDAFYLRGWLYAEKGNMKDAEKDYSRAIELDDRFEDAYYNRGLVLAKMKKHPQAVKDFGQAIKLKAKAVDAYCNRGNAYFQMGKMDLAIADFDAALKMKPYDADIYYNRAAVYMAKGDKEAAMADFKKAARMLHDKAREKFPDLAPLPTSIGEAANKCRVEDYMEYMAPDMQNRVKRAGVVRADLEKALTAFYTVARRWGGKKVRRQGGQISFYPDATTELKGKPGEPIFKIKAEFQWKEECEVLQKFLPCIKDKRSCREETVEGSSFQVRKVDGSWRLVNGKTDEEWNQVFALGEGMVDIIKEAKTYLTGNKDKMSYNQLALSLAVTYTQRLQGVIVEAKLDK